MTVTNYMSWFDESVIRCEVIEDPKNALAQFTKGIQLEIRREILYLPRNNLDQAL